MKKRPLVSVILIAETSDPKEILKSAQDVFDQTYGKDNIDLIISYMDDLEPLKEKLQPLSFNIQYSHTKAGIEMFQHALDMVKGEVVFYKSINNVLWFPRHIEVHVDEFQKNKETSWMLSHVEYRDVAHPEHPLNTIGYRIESPPEISKICVDEIAHLKSVKANWNNCVVTKDGKEPLFYAGLVTKEWNDAGLFARIPEEMTVVQWISSKREGNQGASFEEIAVQLGVPKVTEVTEDIVENDDSIEVVRKIPTVVGNKFLDEYSNGIREVIRNTEDITDIGIKRTVGMGDIIVAEPIVRKLKEKYKGAKITFYTAKPEIVKFFTTQPDNVIAIGEDQVLKDYLSDTNHQVKYDLDLAYESRAQTAFIDAYAEVCDIEFNEAKDRYPSLSLNGIEAPQHRPDKKFAVVVADGSGWVGKTWGTDNYKKIVEYLQNDYEVIEPGFSDFTGITDEKYNKVELNDLVWYLANCELFIGGDNGPMHISRGFSKPAVIVAGAALPYYTNPNREGVFYAQNDSLECLGCKHRQFFNLNGEGGVTFVANCDNESKGLCMTSLTPEQVIKGIDNLLDEPLSIIDDSPLKFHFNIPNWSYYKNEETDLIQRERVEEHPDQDKDISTEYDFRWEEIYEKYSKTFIEEVKKHKPTGTLLDVGCNMGLVVEAANVEGYDAYGIDINEPSIEKAKETFPHLKDKFDSVVPPDDKWDIIVMNQTLEHISNPIDFLEDWKEKLNDDGFMFIGVPSLDEEGGRVNLQKFQTIGTGEHTFLPTNKSFDVIMDKAGLEYEHLQETSKGLFVKAKIKK